MALEVLGLGNNVIPTLGMMIFWSQRFSAVLRGMYWWWSPPIMTIALSSSACSSYLQGLDRYINPDIPVNRRRQRRKQSSQPAIPACRTSTLVEKAAQADTSAAGESWRSRIYRWSMKPPPAWSKRWTMSRFTLQPGERMGLIGESGSGKTTMATALMRLSRPPAYIAGGQVLLEGRDLLSIDR